MTKEKPLKRLIQNDHKTESKTVDFRGDTIREK